MQSNDSSLKTALLRNHEKATDVIVKEQTFTVFYEEQLPAYTHAWESREYVKTLSFDKKRNLWYVTEERGSL